MVDLKTRDEKKNRNYDMPFSAKFISKHVLTISDRSLSMLQRGGGTCSHDDIARGWRPSITDFTSLEVVPIGGGPASKRKLSDWSQSFTAIRHVHLAHLRRTMA